MEIEPELWRAVIGFDGLYEISDQGRCRSVDRAVLRRNSYGLVTVNRKGRMLKALSLGRSGYVGYQLCRDGKIKFLTAHHLVAEAFHGVRPDGMQCAHLNGRRADNRAANLAWVTPAENQAHRHLHGTSNAGENAHQAKLTWANVEDARSMRADGMIWREIAEKFGVSLATIQSAVEGKTWRPTRRIDGRTVYLPGLRA